MNTGEIIRLKRKELGYSVRKFAKEVGISVSYLSLLERGRRPLPESNQLFQKITEKLGIYNKDAQDILRSLDTVEPPLILVRKFIQELSYMRVQLLSTIRDTANQLPDSSQLISFGKVQQEKIDEAIRRLENIKLLYSYQVEHIINTYVQLDAAGKEFISNMINVYLISRQYKIGTPLGIGSTDAFTNWNTSKEKPMASQYHHVGRVNKR